LDDVRRRLHLIERNRLRTFLDLDELAQRLWLAHAGEAPPFAIRLGVCGLRRLLRRTHGDGVVCVMLAGLAETHSTVVGDGGRSPARRVLDVIEVCATHASWHGGVAE